MRWVPFVCNVYWIFRKHEELRIINPAIPIRTRILSFSLKFFLVFLRTFRNFYLLAVLLDNFIVRLHVKFCTKKCHENNKWNKVKIQSNEIKKRINWLALRSINGWDFFFLCFLTFLPRESLSVSVYSFFLFSRAYCRSLYAGRQHINAASIMATGDWYR